MKKKIKNREIIDKIRSANLPMSPNASTIAHTMNEIDDHSEKTRKKVPRLLVTISQKLKSSIKNGIGLWNGMLLVLILDFFVLLFVVILI